MRKKFLYLFLLFPVQMLFGQTTGEPLVQNVYQRNIQRLNGYWNYLVDPLETGYYNYRRQPDANGFFKDVTVDNVQKFKEYDFDSSPVMSIPGDWNTQNPELFYMRERCGFAANSTIIRRAKKYFSTLAQ